jgi:hypothetical protein
MSTTMKNIRSRRARLLAFAPALVCIGVTAFVASGASLVSGASAVTSVNVTGTVSTTLATDPVITGGGGATGCADETLASGFASAFRVSNGCQVSINSNGLNGVSVLMDNNNAAANDANGFFCVDADGAGAGARDCGTVGNQEARLDNVTGVNQTVNAADTFGVTLMAVAGSGSPAAGTGAPTLSGATPTAAAAVWNEIPDNGAATQLCRTAGPNTTDATCQFAFGGQGSGATQSSGDYSGTLRLTWISL